MAAIVGELGAGGSGDSEIVRVVEGGRRERWETRDILDFPSCKYVHKSGWHFVGSIDKQQRNIVASSNPSSEYSWQPPVTKPSKSLLQASPREHRITSFVDHVLKASHAQLSHDDRFAHCYFPLLAPLLPSS
ncbi:hypothetical protein SCLCIDRAFT_1223860 [Scleroderma citrinum Foug A]|uniref:Uncharacterized protein n=1 Tax=Scleroderma citrinum Foug A TaxID=1036808 RepID=A0A0C3D8B1_9AGAM|nr:hypothetical protein SCLCIDRAFT_1223860 [Scleroderma citrinum Foug A]